MDETKQVLYCWQLMRYFIVHKDYMRVKFINVQSKDNISDDYHNIWLASKKSSQYPIICITTLNDNDDTLMKLAYDTLVKNLKKPGRMLHINLAEQARSYSEENIEHVAMKPGSEIDESILKVFNNLDTVLIEVEDEKKEIVKLQTAVQDYAMSYQQRKHGPISFIKDKLTVNFIVFFILSTIFTVGAWFVSQFCEVQYTSAVIALGAMYKAFITVVGQWFRFITAAFIHGDIVHYLCNMIALLDCCFVVSRSYSPWKCTIILLAGIITGNVFVFAGEGNMVSLGMSGGLYALLAAIMIFYYQNGYFKVKEIKRGAVNTLVGNAILSLMPSVSMLAHLGGFAAGIILGFIFSEKTDKALKKNIIAAALAGAVAVGYLAYNNRDFNMYYGQTDMEVIKVYQTFGLKEYSRKVYDRLNSYYSRY